MTIFIIRSVTKMGLEDMLPEERDRVVMECYYCHDMTMFQIHYNKKYDWSMYECVNDSCKKTYLQDWTMPKESSFNWYERQKEKNDNGMERNKD